MDALIELESLQDAVELLRDAQCSLARGSTTVWLELDHSVSHLKHQLKDLLAEESRDLN